MCRIPGSGAGDVFMVEVTANDYPEALVRSQLRAYLHDHFQLSRGGPGQPPFIKRSYTRCELCELLRGAAFPRKEYYPNPNEPSCENR